MLIERTGNGNSPKMKHHSGSRRPKEPKPTVIVHDVESMARNDLAREVALQAYNEGKIDNKWQNDIIDTAEASIKKKISTWRATFERACDKMNSKINALVKQVIETDRQGETMNGFHETVNNMNRNFFSDLGAMTRESKKRDVTFIKKVQTKKFKKDLITLANENEKRDAGFYRRKRLENQAPKFKKICEDKYTRNEKPYEKKAYMRPNFKYDAAISMNDKRNEISMAKRPGSKLDVFLTNDKRAAEMQKKQRAALEKTIYKQA